MPSLLKPATFAGAVLLALHASMDIAAATTIKLWFHEHPPRNAVDEKAIAAFEKQNPGIHIERTLIPYSEFGTKLLTAFATGAAPDLFNQVTLELGQYYAAGLLAPIDMKAAGYSDQAALDRQFQQGALAGITFAGKVYGLPTEVSDYYCYANNKLWAEKGLDPAKDYPKTWEQMVDVAEKLTVRDPSGVPARRGFDFNWSGSVYMWLQFNPMVSQLGGQMVDETTYSAKLNTPEVAKTFQYWADWANRYHLGGPQYPESRPAFLAGEIATDCSMGIWGVPLIEKAGIAYTPFPVPRWSGAAKDNGFDNYAYYLMVNAKSPPEVQAAAWKFARFYTNYASDLFSTAGLFVPTPELLASKEAMSGRGMDVYLSELSRSNFSPRIAGFNAVGDALLRARDRIVQGNTPVADVLPGLDEEVNRILVREKAKAEASR
jgi:multiple sugar transport system substrate-binding protein